MSKSYIAITGFAKSGKSEIVEHISKRYGFRIIRPSRIISQELQKCNPENNIFSRAQLRAKGEELRRLYGPAYYLDMIGKSDEKILIDGPRHLDSIREISSRGGLVIGLVARTEIRWQRALQCADKITDLSLSGFIADEKLEFNDISGKGGQLLPILWGIDPENIIDTSDSQKNVTLTRVDAILTKHNIEPIPIEENSHYER